MIKITQKIEFLIYEIKPEANGKFEATLANILSDWVDDLNQFITDGYVECWASDWGDFTISIGDYAIIFKNKFISNEIVYYKFIGPLTYEKFKQDYFNNQDEV